MGAVLAIAAVLILVGIVAWFVIGSGVMAASVEEGKVPDEREHDALRYRHPAGQDPSYVLTALMHRGFDAQVERERGEDVIVVPWPGGPSDLTAWREQVRRAIAEADRSMVDPALRGERITFVDEPHGRPTG